MKKINIFLLAITAMMMVSCGDFLEPKSRSEYTPKDASSLSELLLGNAYPTADVSMSTDLQLLDDDITGAPFQETTDYNLNGLLGGYSWQPKIYEWQEDANEDKNVDLYYVHYSKILGCNAVWEQANKVTDEEDEDLLNYVKAQALTLRAFFYLSLVNIYGWPYNDNKDALGVPLKTNSGVEEENLSRSTVAEVYDLIVSDLKQSIELYDLLPKEWKWRANYRTSLPMAQLLLSRAYLYMEDWENAAKYAKEVMSNKSFQITNLNTLEKNKHYDFHSYTAVTETIFPYGNLVTDCCYWVYLCSRGAENRPFLRASDELLETLNECPGDLRKYFYIINTNYTYTNKKGEQELMPAAYSKVNTSTTEGKEYQPIRQASVNTFGRSLRVSEAYLNYIEAEAMLYKQGNAAAGTEALSTLNTFRVYRYDYDNYTTLDITDPEELVQFVRRERRREFCFEDMRWNDLRRWGMPEIKHVWYPDANTKTTYTLKEKDTQYCLPLPTEAMNLNSLLEQNELCDERTGVNETIK